jgi:hypothetical protein
MTEWQIRLRLALAVLAGLLLSGCAAHSFPLTNRFIAPVAKPCAAGSDAGCPAPSVVQVFADTNGTLYPSGWQLFVHPQMSEKHPGVGRWRAGNLLAQSAHSRKFRALIERDSARQLAEISAFGRTHARIFILVHGFNAPMESTIGPFSAIEDQLDLKPGDGIIRFYWDGLTGTGVGAIGAWLRAANDSQLVGSRGLRDLLNQLDHREIYIISHSRGASVVMSALGNPVYTPKFSIKMLDRLRNWGSGYRNLLAPEPLHDRGNAIHILMLAPAIDRIDFCDASEVQPVAKNLPCTKLRPLGSQVKSLAYTVNPGDPVLKKFVLSSKVLIPTGLGSQADIGRALKAEGYSIFQEYLFAKPEAFHGFKDYIANHEFEQMLFDAGIGKMPGNLH